jgi:hypothetical protein
MNDYSFEDVQRLHLRARFGRYVLAGPDMQWRRYVFEERPEGYHLLGSFGSRERREYAEFMRNLET